MMHHTTFQRIKYLLKKYKGGVDPKRLYDIWWTYNESRLANRMSHWKIVRFNPEFYLVAPHGVGETSFSYYLSHLGVQASNLSSLYINGKMAFIRFPVPKVEKTYARGVSCDRFFQGKPLCYGRKDQKIIQIVRDPVDLAAHVVNFRLALLISAGSGRGGNILGVSPSIKELLEASFPMHFMFTSMRKCIKASGQTILYDTTDLSERESPRTMRSVAHFLCVPFNEKIDSICKIPYGATLNKMWSVQQDKCYMVPFNEFQDGKIGLVVPGLTIYPSLIYDFWANFFYRSHALDSFMYNGVEYIVSMPERYFYKLDKAIQQKPWDKNKQAAMKVALEIWLEQKNVYDKLYSKYRKTPDDIISIIRSDPHFHTLFMRAMEHEISLPARDAPHIVERWKNFHRL